MCVRLILRDVCSGSVSSVGTAGQEQREGGGGAGSKFEVLCSSVARLAKKSTHSKRRARTSAKEMKRRGQGVGQVDRVEVVPPVPVLWDRRSADD